MSVNHVYKHAIKKIKLLNSFDMEQDYTDSEKIEWYTSIIPAYDHITNSFDFLDNEQKKDVIQKLLFIKYNYCLYVSDEVVDDIDLRLCCDYLDILKHFEFGMFDIVYFVLINNIYGPVFSKVSNDVKEKIMLSKRKREFLLIYFDSSFDKPNDFIIRHIKQKDFDLFTGALKRNKRMSYFIEELVELHGMMRPE